ncbi:MAG TPA: hypothetical protein VHC20_03935 [Candidatus Paceibacterota bacterium]|jgi:hypothetical protein|nr:hypothetical protein [Candidatus Paceibacterota bacterium]
MNEELKSELLLTCATWLARADAFKAEAERAVSRREKARLAASAETLEWAACDLATLIEQPEEETSSENTER